MKKLILILAILTPANLFDMQTMIIDCQQSEQCDYWQLNNTISAWNVTAGKRLGIHINPVKNK